MTKFLALISMLALSLALSAKELSPPDTIFHYGCEGSLRYAIAINVNDDTSFTGICIMKSMNVRVVGSVVNEFGIKAFDFIYDKSDGSLELHNVISFFDKRFVRRTVKGDWKYLLAFEAEEKKDRNRKVTVDNEGTIILENVKHHIRYILSPLASI